MMRLSPEGDEREQTRPAARRRNGPDGARSDRVCRAPGAARPRGGGAGAAQAGAGTRARYDRIIRATVGLRPHRPSGFVLRADWLDGKTVVHNYGHGGAGMSLSWGTGQMAAELALEHAERRAAVIGCGVSVALGRLDQRTAIAAARLRGDDLRGLRAPGYDLEHVAGRVHADLRPDSVDCRTPEWEAQFRRAVEIAYRQSAVAYRTPLRHLVDLQLRAHR